MIEELYQRYYIKIFPNYRKELKKAVGESKTLLDVGCGSNSPIASFSSTLYSVGIDAFKPSIEKSKEKNIHNKYYNINVLDISKQFESNSFDVVLASDLIEHLDKKMDLN